MWPLTLQGRAPSSSVVQPGGRWSRERGDFRELPRDTCLFLIGQNWDVWPHLFPFKVSRKCGLYGGWSRDQLRRTLLWRKGWVDKQGHNPYFSREWMIGEVRKPFLGIFMSEVFVYQVGHYILVNLIQYFSFHLFFGGSPFGDALWQDSFSVLSSFGGFYLGHA